MKTLAAMITMLATQVAADITCFMQDKTCSGTCPQTQVRFSIDPNQFVAPQDPNDPPRQHITQVSMGARQFRAQAIMMEDGIIGFHQDTEDNSTLMIVQADGTARLSLQPENTILTGSCTPR